MKKKSKNKILDEKFKAFLEILDASPFVPVSSKERNDAQEVASHWAKLRQIYQKNQKNLLT